LKPIKKKQNILYLIMKVWDAKYECAEENYSFEK
tara:strand:+ start:153 stop:254 length:102 start_codon:yes stop_codon:yes gene_type:complete